MSRHRTSRITPGRGQMAEAGDDHGFWYDPRLPFIETRTVRDGRRYCFDPHSHETFSIGIILGGGCTYLNTRRREQVARGAVTIMNPGEVHACNPVGEASWSYHMVYVDAGWLAGLQRQNGATAGVDFACYGKTMSDDPRLFAALGGLHDTLSDPAADRLAKESAAVACLGGIDAILSAGAAPRPVDDARLRRAADYIADHWSEQIALDDLCRASGLSPSHLIRTFGKRYGLTPHAYLIDRRVQVARELIRRGRSILDAALETRFFDQAHFHRAFKRATAITPGEYARWVTPFPRPGSRH